MRFKHTRLRRLPQRSRPNFTSLRKKGLFAFKPSCDKEITSDIAAFEFFH
jgi:hypothetical protein